MTWTVKGAFSASPSCTVCLSPESSSPQVGISNGRFIYGAKVISSATAMTATVTISFVRLFCAAEPPFLWFAIIFSYQISSSPGASDRAHFSIHCCLVMSTWRGLLPSNGPIMPLLSSSSMSLAARA